MLKIAVVPARLVWLNGWVVMLATTTDSATTELVTLPKRLLTTML